MVMTEDQRPVAPRVMSRRAKLLAAAVVAAAGIAIAASCVQRAATTDPPTEDAKEGGVKFRQQLFRDWPKPDLVLIVSGQQHGYLLPCGCSRPQIGGLERRYNFVQSLKERGWPVIGIDVGDIPQKEVFKPGQGPAYIQNVQGLLKYKYSMDALKRIGYSAVTIGENEAAPGLMTTLCTFTLNNNDDAGKPLPPFVLAANLEKKEERFPGLVQPWHLASAPGTDIKIGIIGVVGPKVAKRMRASDQDVVFPDDSTAKAIDAAVKAMAPQKPDLRVLLYQGYPEEAKACAQAFPNRFQVILCATTFDEPPAEPESVKEAGTLIVTIGHKSKYVGAVGINRTDTEDPKFQLRYQLVRMTEEFLTPEGKEKGHPILELLEAYTLELKGKSETGEYLAKYQPSKHPLQVGQPAATMPKYIGYTGEKDRCKKCHEHAYDIWDHSAHARAYDTLVKATRPSNRQFDGECIVCHTVGFGFETGFRNHKDTPTLKNVGCESCHGPASQHASNPNNPQLRAALNPWKGDAKRIEIDLCVKCHDLDNDVNWPTVGFAEKWKKIVHKTPE
jgi:hypothetical protein